MHVVALTLALALVKPCYPLDAKHRPSVHPLSRPRLASLNAKAAYVESGGGDAPDGPTAPAGSVSPLMAAAPASAGGATVAASIINLAKNIVGSGVLALAAGVAAFSSAKVAVVPALA